MNGKMTDTATSSSTGKRAPRGQAQHSSMKGCSCKRSQCIKNYCDCYQSMAVCTKLCRCIGCRNTEERKAVNPATSKSANAKRDRAAALSAKAAAAAAKAGNIQTKASAGTVPIKGNGNTVGSVFAQKKTTPPTAAVAKTSNGAKIPPLPAQQLQSAVNEQNSKDANVTPCPQPVGTDTIKSEPSEASQSQSKPKDSNGSKIFTRAVNAAVLDCLMVQATEGEKLGLNEVQISQLVMHEFIRGLNSIFRDGGIGNN